MHIDISLEHSVLSKTKFFFLIIGTNASLYDAFLPSSCLCGNSKQLFLTFSLDSFLSRRGARRY